MSVSFLGATYEDIFLNSINLLTRRDV